jgi:UDP-3-O-[3-hydroxymyristoyl] glucosamine N-acyltransferase
MEWDIKELLSEIGIEYKFEGGYRKISQVSSIFEATEDELSFCFYEGEQGISLVSISKAGVIICLRQLEGLVHPTFPGQQLFFVENPKFALVQIMSYLYKKKPLIGISPTAVISESSKIGSNCYIGNFTEIGDNCQIGDNTVISSRVNIVQNCTIGNGCVLGPGVTIGNDGFAFVRDGAGKLERFPHLKGVKIGNNVEISGNSNVDRGSLSDTKIADGTRIDALVHIAHNVVVGKNCELTAGTVIGGSAIIGEMSWTGLNSTVKDRIKIGNRVLVGAGAAVIHDVPDGDIVAGVPAKSIKHKTTIDSVRLFMMAGQKNVKDLE